MRVLAGVVPPTAGTVLVAGHDVRTDALQVKRSVGYCPDVGGLVPRATAWEHLQLAARLRRLTDWEKRGRDLLERFELGDAAHRVTGGFSHGMGRRLSVLLAALHEPEVLLLDEPFDGVDPIGVEATLDVIGDARARGACVLVSTHLRELAVAGLRPRAGPARRVAGRDRGRRRDDRRGGGACLPWTSRLEAVADVGHLMRFRARTGTTPGDAPLGHGRDAGWHPARRRGPGLRARRRRQRPRDVDVPILLPDRLRRRSWPSR